ncbi:MAG TPA: extracellular solute-binding protein, partial [Anaerolineae bacterium]|nr:extracellular solute-binding protein [Anaerolineae bacterium]
APPADWSDLISATLSFLFAFADGAQVSDPVLVAYQALGGTIIDAEGQPALTLEALAQLLDIYRSARVAGAISLSSLDWLDPDAAWIAFRTSEAAITVARASRYLAAQAGGVRLAYARTPSIDQRTAPPVGRSWNLALVARDPRRQALAVALIKLLGRAENAAAWTQAGHILPASTAALALWDAGEGYTAFVRGELNRALPPPSPAALDAVSPAFLSAVRDVLTGRATPQAAAEAAVEAVARGEQ